MYTANCSMDKVNTQMIPYLKNLNTSLLSKVKTLLICHIFGVEWLIFLRLAGQGQLPNCILSRPQLQNIIVISLVLFNW